MPENGAGQQLQDTRTHADRTRSPEGIRFEEIARVLSGIARIRAGHDVRRSGRFLVGGWISPSYRSEHMAQSERTPRAGAGGSTVPHRHSLSYTTGSRG